MSGRNRWAIGMLALAAGLGAVASCLDDGAVLDPDRILPTGIASTPTVSNPLPRPAASAFSPQLSARGSEATDVVYVSLPPGTVPEGGLATVRDTRTGASVLVPMAEGGFDPVPIVAETGDEITIDVQEAGGGTVSFALRVRAAARPIVVRTDPPPRKRDVPLNTSIVVVFSEPIRAGSEAAVRLLKDGVALASTATRSVDGIRVTLEPAGLLAPSADYVVAVSTGLTDVAGDALEQPVSASFTTGTSSIVASVATDPAALLTNPFSNESRSFTMSAVLRSDGQVAGSFSVFYPGPGFRWFGRVTCFRIVDDSTAWVAGVLEGANDTSIVGHDVGWRTLDHGAAAGVPDELSLGLVMDGLGTAADFCANTPRSDPVYPVVSGNIVVNGSGPPPPSASGMSEIAFAVWPNGGIQVIDADGTNGRVLTSVLGDFSPSWSPDGSKIAFDRNRGDQFAGDIYVMNADGSGLKRLTADDFDDGDPAWSPNGSQIAFGRNGAIYVMNASDGSGVRALTSGGYDFHPTWSPDGSRIAFASSRSGTNAIYVMAADGTGILQITSDLVGDYHPWWSPDGQRIAFQREESAVGVIYLVNPDGTGLTKLTLFGRTPTWSPDGRVIVFEQYGLTTVNADGSGMFRLGIGFDPAWSPTGSMPPRPQPFVFLAIAGGDAQRGAVGATLSQPLTVRATRADGSPVAGAHISWYLPNGGLPSQPYLSTYLLVTDAQGLASVSLTLGATAPEQIKIRAAVTDGTGLTPGVEFTATAVP